MGHRTEVNMGVKHEVQWKPNSHEQGVLGMLRSERQGKRSLGRQERRGFRAKAADLGKNLSRNLEEALTPFLF